jgi:hypothetical protein
MVLGRNRADDPTAVSTMRYLRHVAFFCTTVAVHSRRQPAEGQSWHERFLSPKQASYAPSFATAFQDGHSVVHVPDFLSVGERETLIASAGRLRRQMGLSNLSRPERTISCGADAASSGFQSSSADISTDRRDCTRPLEDSEKYVSNIEWRFGRPQPQDDSNPMLRLSIEQRFRKDSEVLTLSSRILRRLLSLLEEELPSLANTLFGRARHLDQMHTRWYTTSDPEIGVEPMINIYEARGMK